jgi:hypothetical protein
MTAQDSIRFLNHQAAECRGRDAGEALCLLLPAIMRILELDPMDDVEAAAFRQGFRRDLAALPDGLIARAVAARDMRTNGCNDSEGHSALARCAGRNPPASSFKQAAAAR